MWKVGKTAPAVGGRQELKVQKLAIFAQIRTFLIVPCHSEGFGERKRVLKNSGAKEDYLAGGFLVLRITMCSTFRLSMV